MTLARKKNKKILELKKAFVIDSPFVQDSNFLSHVAETRYGLKQDWGGETVFVNPPFGKEQAIWIKKCFEESRKPNTTIVLLIPARTDTIVFHKYLYPYAELRFIKGRLKFGGSNNSAPFPSMITILRGKNES